MSKDRQDEPTVKVRLFPKLKGNEGNENKTVLADVRRTKPWDAAITIVKPSAFPLLEKHPQSGDDASDCGTVRARLPIESQTPRREAGKPSQLLMTGADMLVPNNTGVLKTLISSRTSGHSEIQEYFICGRAVSLSGWIRFVQMYERESQLASDGTPEGMNDFAYRQGFHNPQHPWFR